MLDFQFNQGVGSQNAFIDIGGFGSTGGSLSGSPTYNGGASGNLTGTVHIVNSDPVLNEYLQNFTAGTAFQFQIAFGGLKMTAPDGTSTDSFGLAFYKGSDFTMPQLNDGSQGDFFFEIDVNGDGSTTVNQASSPKGLVTAAPVLTPEPGTLVLLGVGLGVVVLRRRAGRAG